MSAIPFGLLDSPARAVTFAGGTIRPLPAAERAVTAEFVREHGHGGWLWGSAVGAAYSVESRDLFDDAWTSAPRPITHGRPQVWAVPPTHSLDPAEPVAFSEIPRPLYAVVLALGWAYGRQTSFYLDGWGADTERISTRDRGRFWLSESQVGYFADRIFATVAGAPEASQKRICAALFLLNRATAQVNWWERFQWTYIVLDSCWKVLVDLQRISEPKERKDRGHGRRIRWMERALGITEAPESLVARIVDRRNTLVHEGLWCATAPGHAFDDHDIQDTIALESLVDRLLLHVFDVRCELRSRKWEFCGGARSSLGKVSDEVEDAGGAGRTNG